MASTRALLGAVLLLAPLAYGVPPPDQTDALGSDEQVWAAVAYINHGESTPILGNLTTILTPQGAQQMLRQGEAFRRRYLNGTERQLDAQDAGITGIDRFVLDSYQVRGYSTDEEWVVGGATAFFQGLYPAQTKYWNNEAGGLQLAKDFLVSNGEIVDYPLGGYQYGYVQTLSSTDSQFPSLQGTTGCTEWSQQTARNMPQTEEIKLSLKNSDDFYQRLFSQGPLANTVPLSQATLVNAYELYELVKYMYAHNGTVHGLLDDTGEANNTLSQLESYAYIAESAITRAPPGSTDEAEQKLYTIAGRTLAARIHAELIRNIATDGVRNKLSILFGSHRPMMSFFDLAGLVSSDSSAVDSPFPHLPAPGAAVVFELVGRANKESLPDRDSLYIRFAYRPTAEDDEEFYINEIFPDPEDQGRQGSMMPWNAFSSKMLNVSVRTSEWCEICRPTSLWFCDRTEGVLDDTEPDSSGGHISPAVAGFIGAAVTIAVLALVGLILVFGFGVRLRKKESGGAGGGGFRGKDKKAEDPDVIVGKTGTQKPRIGSWELKDDEGALNFPGAGIVTEDFSKATRDEDEMDREPVQVREQI